MWFLCVGNYKIGLQAKKAKIDSCHLSDDKKAQLKALLDTMWQRAKNNEFENREKGEITLGMFGAGFGSFKGDISNDTAIAFIKMCVAIDKSGSNEEALSIAEKALDRDMKGIGTATVSQYLHCLKPSLFPIINGRYGGGTIIYDCLGIPLEDTGIVKNYIRNTRYILEYRDSHFSFVNL